MADTLSIDKYKYIQRLLPDLSWLDYVEKCFFQTGKNDGGFYYMEYFDTANKIIDIEYTSRIIIASTHDCELASNDHSLLIPLNKYHGLYVYAYVTDQLKGRDKIIFKNSSRYIGNADNEELGYYILLRF